MFKKNTVIGYSILTILSTGKKSFEAMARVLGKKRDKVRRMMQPSEKSFNLLYQIARLVFRNTKHLVVAIDDTLIRKIFSQNMVGTCWFYDTKLGRRVTAFRLLAAAITDGHYTIPLLGSFLFDLTLFPDSQPSKIEIVQQMMLNIIKMFPDKEITFALDGAFASVELFKWCLNNKIRCEGRMPSNRKVEYQGKRCAVKELPIIPKGRKMACTAAVKWYEMPLYVTAHRRINKHGEETIIYTSATYQDKPIVHATVYKLRWRIEMMFRSLKQSLGLGDCFSTLLDVQLNHVAAVFLAYALIQLECKKRKIDKPETAIKALKQQDPHTVLDQFLRLDHIFQPNDIAHA